MGLIESLSDLVVDTADSAIDVVSGTAKTTLRGVRRVAHDTEEVVKDVLDPFGLFHDDADADDDDE